MKELLELLKLKLQSLGKKDDEIEALIKDNPSLIAELKVKEPSSVQIVAWKLIMK